MAIATTTSAPAPLAASEAHAGLPISAALSGQTALGLAGEGGTLQLPGAESQETVLVGLTGMQRIAALLIAVGPDASTQILKHLPEESIEQISLELFRMRQVSSRVTDAVLEDIYDTLITADYAETGGVEFAQELMKRTLGPERANELINKITARVRSGPFDFLRDIDPAQIVSFLQAEHPQTIALVLAHLPPKQAATVLTGLHPDVQPEVSMRIALMDRTAPDVVKEVDRLLRQKISSVGTQSYRVMGGVKYLVDVLNSADNSSSKSIVDALDEQHPELADEIKKNMFTFEDIAKLSDRDMQRIVREIDSKDLVVALRTANDELRQKFFKGMSQRAAAQLKEDMEVQAPVRLSVVEDAQQKIVAVIRRLEQAEEITIAGGGGGDVLV